MGTMKKYRQLVKELPSKKVVFAFGRFQPPTTGHELLVNAVKKLAQKQGADHVIFASRSHDKKSNPLPVDRKVYFLKRMFPNTNFVAASDEIRTFIEAATFLSKKYKHIVMIAGSDRIPEYKRILNKYNNDVFNFETIEVVSAGERDPDADTASGMSGTKMREAAKKGDFQLFKKGLPHTLTEIDGKRLMNEIRQGMGMEAIKEQIKFETTKIREMYLKGSIFNVGDKVTDGTSVYEILDRGSNYITVVNESGDTSKKWLSAVQPIVVQEDVPIGPAPKEITFKGYTTKNLHHSEDATKAFQTTIERYNKGQIKDPVAILNALKATDTYMKLNDLHLEQGQPPDDKELASWREAHQKARESLNRIGEFMHHMDYWHMHEHEIQDMENKFTPETVGNEFADSVELEGQLIEMKFSATDKIKVARIIAGALGVEDVEKSSNAEELVNKALRKIKGKTIQPAYMSTVHKMLQTADEAGIKWDRNLMKHDIEEGVIQPNGTDKPTGKPVYEYKKKTLAKEQRVNDSDQDAEKDAAGVDQHTKPGHTLSHPAENPATRKMKIKYMTETQEGYDPFFKAGSDKDYIQEDDLDDDEIEKMADGVTDVEHVMDCYDDEEFGVIDDEGNEAEEEKNIKEEALNEVLSRIERLRARVKFAQSKAKRERRIQIALKTRSSNKTINNRARKLAVAMMKKRLARKPLEKLTTSEKERIEGIIAKRKAAIGRLAMRLTPKIKKIEQDRLTHKVYTK